MPHFTVEYSANIGKEVDIPALLRKASQAIIAQNGVFPLAGIRVRAIEVKDYCIADDKPEYAFVHTTLKIGAGRSPEVKAKVCEDLFTVLKAHFFGPGHEQRPLALSMELYEFDEAGTFRYNPLHARLRGAAAKTA